MLITSNLNKRYNYMKSIEDEFIKANYSFFEPNLFEELKSYELINKNKDIKNLVKFVDTQGEIQLIRPDITSTIIQNISSNITKENKLKLFYNTKVYSLVNNKIFENSEIGIEYFGGERFESINEVLSKAVKISSDYGEKFIVEVGSSLFIDKLLQNIDINKDEVIELIKRKSEYKLEELVKSQNKDININKDLDNYSKLLLNIFKLNGNLENIIMKLKELNLYEEFKGTIIELENFNKNNISKNNIKYDLSLILDFKYYRGIVFRTLFKNVNREIIKGGRYSIEDKKDEKDKNKDDIFAIGFVINFDEIINEKLGEEDGLY